MRFGGRYSPALASMLVQRRLRPGYSARLTNIASSDIAMKRYLRRPNLREIRP